MVAHAFLAVAALTERTRNSCPFGLIGLTCNELQHLFAALTAAPAGELGHRLHWSLWRRRHQARARTCHYDDRPPGNIRDHDQRLESEVAGVLSCLATRPGVHRCRCPSVKILVDAALP